MKLCTICFDKATWAEVKEVHRGAGKANQRVLCPVIHKYLSTPDSSCLQLQSTMNTLATALANLESENDLEVFLILQKTSFSTDLQDFTDGFRSFVNSLLLLV